MLTQYIRSAEYALDMTQIKMKYGQQLSFNSMSKASRNRSSVLHLKLMLTSIPGNPQLTNIERMYEIKGEVSNLALFSHHRFS